jgi:heme exporter protein D
MSFETFGDFLAMGDHGLYVWLCYGVSLIVIGANVLALRRRRRQFFRESQALERRRVASTE